MKIAVSTDGETPDAMIDPRFGRSPRFLIINIETGDICVIDNIQNLNAAQGAGIQSAMTVINAGAEAVITGHCGPKAFRVLREAGIKVYSCAAATVRESLELYSGGKLTALENADVDGHWA